MRFEIPECRRCCFCIPLRYGIIIFGYLHLAFNFFFITVQSMRLKRRGLSGLTTESISIYKGVVIPAEMWFTGLLYILDVIFNVMLLIGSHTKRAALIRAYYYYSITTNLATFVTLLLMVVEFDYPVYDYTKICLAFSSFVLQIYLLLLIRREVMKGRYQEGCIGYYNHTSEVIIHPSAWIDKT